jgi:hypothetical protein
MKRAKANQASAWGFSFHDNGAPEYVGVVMAMSETAVRLRVISAVSLQLIGIVEDTGELIDVPRKQCRIFVDKQCCLEAVGKAIEQSRLRLRDEQDDKRKKKDLA